MYGISEKGFTLLELLIAITIIGISFTVLLEVLSSSAREYSSSDESFRTFLELDKKLKERNYEGLEVKEEKLPDFPSAKEVTYSLDGLFFIKYEVR